MEHMITDILGFVNDKNILNRFTPFYLSFPSMEKSSQRGVHVEVSKSKLEEYLSTFNESFMAF